MTEGILGITLVDVTAFGDSKAYQSSDTVFGDDWGKEVSLSQ